MTSGSFQKAVPAASSRPHGESAIDRLEHLRHVVDHAAHLLPAQGPITVFVHHNTLHAFEDLPFHEAVKKGGRIFGNQPYLSEDRYRQELGRGRIQSADLVAVLKEELGPAASARILGFGTRLDLRLAMLLYPIRLAPDAELRWFVTETDALTRYRADAPSQVRSRFLEETRHWVMRDVRSGKGTRRDREALAELFRRFGAATIEQWSPGTWEAFSLQALWRFCQNGVQEIKPPTPPPAVQRHRDLLLEATGEDIDLLVDDLLIRFCAAFLDQGFSDWRLPGREEGFYQAFTALYRQPGGPPDPWLFGLAGELQRLSQAHLDPLDSILESLGLLGVPEAEWDEYLTATLLALRGWAGMIRQMEVRADRAAHPAPPGSLVGYLAIRLILERLALAFIAQQALAYSGPLQGLRALVRDRDNAETTRVEQWAFQVFHLAQVLGWSPGALHQLSDTEWEQLIGEIEAFGPLERRRVFQEAFERRYRNQALDAIAAHARRPAARIKDPQFQVVCCIDEREESFLRHLEELAPRVETFSIAGFFSVAMYYRGAADAHFVPQCPIVVRPQHWVTEEVVYTLEEDHRRRALVRRTLGKLSHFLHVGSRTFATGALVTALLGVLASIPLVARVLFPRLTAQVRKLLGRLVQPPPITELQLERSDPDPGPDDSHIGFNLKEMTTIGERVLRDLGLTSNFARLVFFLGHGSQSLNNPHNSAYNCGACSGTAGGPNARAIARILNDHRVREELAQRGLVVPDDTVFVGGYHNTCNDSVAFFDLDRLPKTHREEFEACRDLVDLACDRNAHERCRRFQSAPLDLTFAAARKHVEERSEDLSQTRPECGHATNALCIVGRRSRTRGLFLDRRSFLNSYDPT